MRRFALVSCNRYVNFTNYGSALQTYALRWAVNNLFPDTEAIALNYCPDSMKEMNPLNPFKHMWDQDEASRNRIERNSLAIHENYRKFEEFYNTQCAMSETKYTAVNFDDSLDQEDLTGYICGSDTIWNTDEFGIDPGYFGCFESMRQSQTIAYAPSFGDSAWTSTQKAEMGKLFNNFKAIGTREDDKLDFVKACTNAPCQRVVDPTLLVPKIAYDHIIESFEHNASYLLYYSRRYNPDLEAYVEKVANELGLEIVEISLRIENADKGHLMQYNAGVEEFLGMVRDASYLVTNSFHGAIFATIFNTPFTVFAREQASTKISELLEWIGLGDRLADGKKKEPTLSLDFSEANQRIEKLREQSLTFLKDAIGDE